MEPQRLTRTGRRELAAAQRRVEKAEGDLEEARVAWAAKVRELGQAAVARELGITAQALSDRVRTIEARSGR